MRKKVNPVILTDMQKYGVSIDEYEPFIGNTDMSVLSALKSHYDRRLPVDLDAWVRVNEPTGFFNCRALLGEQYNFVRNIICGLLFPSYEEQKENPPMVIATHVANSVKLPVYQISAKNYGLEIILKGNFYDWKITVESDKPLLFEGTDLFDPAEELQPLHCDGFPRKKIYGSYEHDHHRFTAQISSDYDLYTFIYLLKIQLGIKK